MSDEHPRLFVGPMSKEIVDIVIEYSSKQPMALIPSRRQIENSGGYVNNWTTSNFSNYVKSKSDNVLLVRDHGGPGQGKKEDDGLESLESDIASNFDLIHIDPWKSSSSIHEGIDRTVDLIEFCCSLSDTCRFEVGTEAAIFPYDENGLLIILQMLRERLGSIYDRVDYAVVQSGVQISGTTNVGKYNPDQLKKMTQLCKEFDVISKEHNGDYLTQKEISSRVENGLECINIAPEFGVIQTRELVKNLSQEEYVKLSNTCLSAKKYEKWLPKDQEPTARIITEISGHYVFADSEISSMLQSHDIKNKVKNAMFKRFDEIISCWDRSK